MAYTHLFTQLNKNDIPTAGGKGANLGELISAGFPVPAGFVLTTSAYDAFIKANNLQQKIIHLANSVVVNDPQSAVPVSEKIHTLFSAGVIPDDVLGELKSSYEALTEGHGMAVAVRSSATAEDLPTASFAGQQNSFLNIQNEAALLVAVKNCWASLWTARAISYRIRHGIDPAAVSLAVVVQRLIPATLAGVLFTANPMNGSRKELVINATWGLGEAIVSGQVTPDTVIVHKSDLSILSTELGTKKVMTVRTGTGTQEERVPEAKQNEAVLNKPMIQSLGTVGVKIEAHYKTAMDIEWAIVEGEVFILQARPITSLPEPQPEALINVVWEPISPNTVWMRRQIVEHMPEPLSPLFEDLYLRQGLDDSIGDLLDNVADIGGTKFNWSEILPHGFAGTINGYAYTTGSINMRAEDVIAVIKVYINIRRFFKMPAFDWDQVALPNYQSIIAKWQTLDIASASEQELLQGMRELATADSAYWWGSALKLGLSRILDPVFDQLLRAPFIRYALPKPTPVGASFLRGFQSKALDAQSDLEALAEMVRESAELTHLVLDTEPAHLLDTIANHPQADAIMDAFQQYLEKYGHQIYNLDFAEPTQIDNPTPILLSFKALVQNPPSQNTRTRQAIMTKEREALVAQTREALNPLSQKLFDWVWHATKHNAPYREDVMFYMGAAWPTLRTLARELGERLTASGVMTQADDIYYLNSTEISEAIEARMNKTRAPDFKQLVQDRRALRAARKLLTPLPTVPERGEMKFGPINMTIFSPTPADDLNTGPTLKGYAVSTGQVTAPAMVIHSIDDFAKMAPGTILVCTTTTPAWTPLFSQAVGLVTDVGGALAHGSIVAREFGIPAVMGTGVATERIKTGMMLRVDGNAGIVTLLDEVDLQTAQKPVSTDALEAEKSAKQRKRFAVAIVAIIGLIWWKRRK